MLGVLQAHVQVTDRSSLLRLPVLIGTSGRTCNVGGSIQSRQASFARSRMYDEHQQHRSACGVNVVALHSSQGDDSEGEENDSGVVSSDSSFDGEGFAGYLGPYALALFASIGVTWAFVKFVLSDY